MEKNGNGGGQRRKRGSGGWKKDVDGSKKRKKKGKEREDVEGDEGGRELNEMLAPVVCQWPPQSTALHSIHDRHACHPRQLAQSITLVVIPTVPYHHDCAMLRPHGSIALYYNNDGYLRTLFFVPSKSDSSHTPNVHSIFRRASRAIQTGLHCPGVFVTNRFKCTHTCRKLFVMPGRQFPEQPETGLGHAQHITAL